MRKTIVYLAMSLDGMIADADGSVDWLNGSEDAEKDAAWMQSVDTILMGYRTYHQIVTELAKEAWPYPDQQCYVLTHRLPESKAPVCFTDQPLEELVSQLKSCPGKNIWILGGASLARQMLRLGLVDEYWITVIPIVLHSGIRLFEETSAEATKLKLISAKQNREWAELRYAVKKENAQEK